MKVGDVVWYGWPVGGKQGLILEMFKPSGHRTHRCKVVWFDGTTSEHCRTLLRRAK